MLDHVGITVADYGRSRSFYGTALKPLGLAVQMEVTAEQTGGGYEGVGFGTPGKPGFWVSWARGAAPSGPMHLAFAAGCGRSTIRTITGPSSSTPTATTSRRSATARPDVDPS